MQISGTKSSLLRGIGIFFLALFETFVTVEFLLYSKQDLGIQEILGKMLISADLYLSACHIRKQILGINIIKNEVQGVLKALRVSHVISPLGTPKPY